MRANPSDQEVLLSLADLDTQINQLNHRKASLAEHDQLKQLNVRRRSLGEQITAAQTRGGDAEAQLRPITGDLEVARTRLERNQKRIDDGVVNEPRSIKGVQDEIAHLRRRIDDLEEQSLDLMQRIEDEQGEVARLSAQKAELEDEMRAVMATRDTAGGELDAQLDTLERQRSGLEAKLPAELTALYDKVSERMGTGAALLRARKCTGCGLEIDAVTLSKYAAADPQEVLRCLECGRILVRTSASGLA